MSDRWETNASLREIAAWVKGRRNVAVLTHLKPDGDALGSAIAATRAIRLSTKGATGAMAWFVGPMPTYFESLADHDEARLLGDADLPENEYDGVLIVDTGSWSQLEATSGWIEDRREMCAVIDHHRQGDGDVGVMRHIDPEAAAACQLVVEWACELFGVNEVSKLPVTVCEAGLVGLATDTGWFRHSNTSARALRTAAGLLEAGVDHSRVYEMVEQQDRPGRLRLMGRALCSMELLEGGRIALMTVTLRDFEAAGATQADSGGFSDLPLAIAGVMVGAVITEGADRDGTPTAKVSMRSKNGPGAVDVNEVARLLGGGGHARAAGARMYCSMEEGRRRVLEALR